MFVKPSTVGYHENKIKELKEKLEVTSKIEDKRRRTIETIILEHAINNHITAATSLIDDEIFKLTQHRKSIEHQRCNSHPFTSVTELMNGEERQTLSERLENNM